MGTRDNSGFIYRTGLLARKPVLYCDDVALARLAEKYATPLYVYSAAIIRERYETFDAAFTHFPHTICYSVKANSNLSLLKMLAKMGAGFDVVSGGELDRVLRASPKSAKQVVFSGVGKTVAEIDAALKADILMFNAESESELWALAERAAKFKKQARVSLRVNPDVAASTHEYISTGLRKHKFGVPIETARALYRRAEAHEWLDVIGVSCHIGSQITDPAPFSEAMSLLADLVRELRMDGIDIQYLDAGGGLAIRYEHGDVKRTPTEPNFAGRAKAYAKSVMEPLRGLGLHLILEPGRTIVGPAGVLLTRVLYLKNNNGKRFVVVDAGYNDLIRPTLYGAHHEIIPVERNGRTKPVVCDVVGPICESGDFFARDREMADVQEGELLATLDVGAYGMSISSNYNTRPRPAEVLVDGRRVKVIRRRETVDDLVRQEL